VSALVDQRVGTRLDLLTDVALAALEQGRRDRGGPVPRGTPAQVAAAVDAALDHDVLPEHGVGDEAALRQLVIAVAAGAADPADPRCAAHLHCPPLPVAVAADLAASALNQSLDSWDQAPAATVLEQRVIAALGDLAGLLGAAGVLTTGGTGSTYTALLLARDADSRPVRLYASALSHFSVQRSAHLLGLPAVVPVPVDGDLRMDARVLERMLADADPAERPVVVATAGTTDTGSIDPLRPAAALVRARGGWLHVDAAYGGGALFSDRYAPLLDGLAEADSVSLDLHKLGWQPAAAGVLLVRDPAAFAPLDRRAVYLNPADDEKVGYTSLLGRSLRTTRRADVLKVAVTLRALGRAGLGARVDTCCDLARVAAARVLATPSLVLARPPVLTTVVFRYVTQDPARSDDVNASLRRRLLREGAAVIGRTELDGRVHLKLTLLNPDATEADVEALLALVVAAGRAEEAL
jgi:L-2,4-diaminobutyrate decarboxylase